jgi:hypothetical protein
VCICLTTVFFIRIIVISSLKIFLKNINFINVTDLNPGSDDFNKLDPGSGHGILLSESSTYFNEITYTEPDIDSKSDSDTGPDSDLN